MQIPPTVSTGTTTASGEVLEFSTRIFRRMVNGSISTSVMHGDPPTYRMAGARTCTAAGCGQTTDGIGSRMNRSAGRLTITVAGTMTIITAGSGSPTTPGVRRGWSGDMTTTISAGLHTVRARHPGGE